jgi:hypothetical protein
MTLRRLVVALTLMCGAWGFARPSDKHAPDAEPEPAAGDVEGKRTEAFNRYRAGQSSHWRHVMVGNNSSAR